MKVRVPPGPMWVSAHWICPTQPKSFSVQMTMAAPNTMKMTPKMYRTVCDEIPEMGASGIEPETPIV